MKLKGCLTRPTIKKYYGTGSLQQKRENPALKEMLKKIKDGGINAFLNDKELKQFAQGLISSFESEGYLNKDKTQTPSGEDIVETGKAWRGLQGAFSLTVLEYQGEAYLLDAVLVKENDVGLGSYDSCPYKFDEEYSAVDGKELRKVQLDKNWAEYTQALKAPSVQFDYGYDEEQCRVMVSWQDGVKERKASFITRETSQFAIIKKSAAMELLKEQEKKEVVFEFSHQDTRAIQIVVEDAVELQEKPWLNTFFERGRFSFDGILPNENAGVASIEEVSMYINDETTALVLLKEFLLKKSEKGYLGYGETGRLISEFQRLFTSPDGTFPACPPIMKTTKDVYQDLVDYAKKIQKENPIPYLHLQAYRDLSPEDTLTPYIEKEHVVNLTNQKLSFCGLVLEVFGEERTVESVCMLSKYTAGNGRNARAVKLFAESIERKFRVNVRLFTTGQVDRPKDNPQLWESDKKWFNTMKQCPSLEVKECEFKDIKTVHDRYFKLVRTDGKREWWVLTAELDQLRFDKDHPHIREDITMETKGTVHEMTFSRIRPEGVPDVVKKLMEEK